jgi:hypothetical protein
LANSFAAEGRYRQGFGENYEGKSHFEGLGVDGRIILKWI